jgi:hypothetical protein
LLHFNHFRINPKNQNSALAFLVNLNSLRPL